MAVDKCLVDSVKDKMTSPANGFSILSYTLNLKKTAAGR